MNIQNQVQAILQKRENELNKIGEKYSENILIPFCRKYGLKYWVVNGTFFFEDIESKWNFTYEVYKYTIPMEDLIEKHGPEFEKELKKIEEVLNMELDHDNYFAYYCHDSATFSTGTDA